MNSPFKHNMLLQWICMLRCWQTIFVLWIYIHCDAQNIVFRMSLDIPRGPFQILKTIHYHSYVQATNPSFSLMWLCMDSLAHAAQPTATSIVINHLAIIYKQTFGNQWPMNRPFIKLLIRWYQSQTLSILLEMHGRGWSAACVPCVWAKSFYLQECKAHGMMSWLSRQPKMVLHFGINLSL